MKKRNFLFGVCVLVLSLYGFAQCPQSNHKNEIAMNSNISKLKDIVDVAASIEDFSTLVTAIKAAGLVTTLKSDGPFTVFAPTNDAFGKLPEDTVPTLLNPENKEQLTKVLTYHVVPGKIMAKDVIAAIGENGGSFTVNTVSGNPLVASIEGGKVVLTDENGGTATVTQTDVDASNGVIHVIDTVVLPK